MDAPTGNVAEPSIGELFGRLTNEGRAFARAEIGLYKAIATRRVGNAAGGFVAIVVAALLLNAALITLIVCFALGLAPHVGPVFAGLIVFAVVGVIAFVLVRYGTAKMKALSGDAEERAALRAGESMP